MIKQGRLVAAGIAIVLGACGGDGADSVSNLSGLRCSDFTYQQDAQTAYNGGARQLDGDSDGIACESLPNRASPTPTPIPTMSPAGLWVGSTSTNRTITGVVLSDGSYYVFYSAPAAPNTIAGVVQGTGTSSATTFTSNNARDFNLEGLGVLPATTSANFGAKQFFNGAVAYATGGSSSFTTTYDSSFELTPVLANVAGTYTGQVASSGGAQSSTITISSSGSVSGTSGGCLFAGSASPRSDGNVYAISVTFGAAPCVFAGQTLIGIAYYNATARRVYAAAPSATRNDGVLFVGSKP